LRKIVSTSQIDMPMVSKPNYKGNKLALLFKVNSYFFTATDVLLRRTQTYRSLLQTYYYVPLSIKQNMHVISIVITPKNAEKWNEFNGIKKNVSMFIVVEMKINSTYYLFQWLLKRKKKHKNNLAVKRLKNMKIWIFNSDSW